MAHDPMTLPEDRRLAGQDILALVDSVGFDAVGGGWGTTRDTELWRFYLFSEFVDEKGPIWIWERLLQAFRKLELPQGITPLDIVIASPREWLYQSNLIRAATVPPAYTFINAREDLGLSDYGIDRMWLIRADSQRAFETRKKPDRLKISPRLFDLRIRRLMAA